MFFNDAQDLVMCDWQGYGIGHPSTEFVYFLSFVDIEPGRDEKLMRVYYEELTKKVLPEEYPWKVFERECEIRTLGLAVSTFNLFRDTPDMLINWSLLNLYILI